MFCDSCGAALAGGAQFCGSCGKAIGGVAAHVPVAVAGAPAAAVGRVQRHIQLLAALWLANGILRLVEVCWVVVLGKMFLPSLTDFMGPDATPYLHGWSMDSLLTTGLVSVGVLLGVFGLVHLLLAWALFQRQPWARMLGLIIGFLALLRFPFGTALGIYTIWVLLPQHSGQEYEQLSRASAS
jgi:hypothetical protein